MSVPVHAVAIYDLGSQDGHVEYFIEAEPGDPPFLGEHWYSDVLWNGAQEVRANISWLAVDGGDVPDEVLSAPVAHADIGGSVHIVGALFHRHVDGDLVFSLVHRASDAFLRQVSIISEDLYVAILREVRSIPESAHGAGFATLGLPTDVSWLPGVTSTPQPEVTVPIVTAATIEDLSTADKTWTFGPRR